MSDKEFLNLAIEIAEENIAKGGGPFGAVIVKDGEVVARSGNSVTVDNDPTAHAEVNCIRKACRVLGTFDLNGCIIYSSCEPCPMCLSAIYWARLDKLFYAATRRDAASAGFDDDFIYKELELAPEKRKKPSEILLRDEASKAFRMWTEKTDKTEYRYPGMDIK